jgi:hypothetical protein
LTQREFYEAEHRAQENYRRIYGQVNRALSELYKTAANGIAQKIKELQIKGNGKGLTVASMKQLEAALRRTGAMIAGSAENIIINGINDAVRSTNGPHLTFLKEATRDIKKISYDIIEKMYKHINRDVIDITYNRLWTDGYKFVERIWKGVSENFQAVVKNIVSIGIAQQRDILKIAEDLTHYAANGKIKSMQRYGVLTRGSAKFKKRIPKWIDYRAMRIARSELYISLQDAAKEQGRRNPAVLSYKWNLTGGGENTIVIVRTMPRILHIQNWRFLIILTQIVYAI